ncbi:MAG: Ig-like domain-containing protein, partial [Ignavibacteriaceae bacterium]|nr:Ig-like domain-containing protein [Ignavibacteriaceae bacterium]
SDVWWGQQTDGIYIKASTNTVIHDNYIHIPNQDPYAHVDGIQSQFAQGFVIYNNVIINDSVYSPEGGGMPIILRAGNAGLNLPVIIYNNFCYMGGAWMPGANNGIVLNLHSGDQDLYPSPPTYLLHNTVIGNGPQLNGVGFDYFGQGNDGKGIFHNNIVAQYGSGTGGISWLITFGAGGAVSPIHVDSVKNNLFYKEWSTVNFAGSFTNGATTASGFDWNYWTGTLGGSGLQTDPLFVNNIGNEPDQGALRGYLQANSPAINAGEDVSYLFDYLEATYGIVLPRTDIEGNSRNLSNPTIGAYKYVPRGPDIIPPEVTGATLLDSITLKITFSEPLDPSTAQNPNNYSINNGITVVSALLTGSVVTLTTSPHSIGTYTVTVSNVEDLAGNIVSPSANSADYEWTVIQDVTPPEVTGATLLDSVTLKIMFSEMLDETTAEDENNYSLSNNINVFNASLSGSEVTLQTSTHSPGSYIVTVVNVEDLAGNPIAQSNTAEYSRIPPDSLIMFPIENVQGVIQEPGHTPLKTIDG